MARAPVAKEITRIVYHVLCKQEDFKGETAEPDEEGAMAPPAKPGQHIWSRCGPSSAIALGENGKVRGVPPTEIWDDVLMRIRLRERGREAEWVCGPPALRHWEEPSRSDDVAPTLRDPSAPPTGSAARDCPYANEKTKFDKKLIMGIDAHRERARTRPWIRRVSGAGPRPRGGMDPERGGLGPGNRADTRARAPPPDRDVRGLRVPR